MDTSDTIKDEIDITDVKVSQELKRSLGLQRPKPTARHFMIPDTESEKVNLLSTSSGNRNEMTLIPPILPPRLSLGSFEVNECKSSTESLNSTIESTMPNEKTIHSLTNDEQDGGECV